jgi:hypothetical protein
MYGFFAIRRLAESNKLTGDTTQRKLAWKLFPSSGATRIPPHKRQDIDKYFDLAHPLRIILSIRELANQVIHSYIFVHEVDSRDRLRGA